MHEASLVASLLRQANEIASRYGESRVTEIRIEVGPLAGVEPLLFSEAYHRLKAGSLAAEAVLIIDYVGLTCRCQACQLKYETKEMRFECPSCGSIEVDVTEGDAVVLNSVTLEHRKEAAASP